VIQLTVDGERREIDVPAHWTLLRTLRDGLGCTAVKHGCGEGVCGACAVLIDGRAANACSVLAVQVDGADVTTVAGLSADGMHPLQAEMVAAGAVQCGFCTPGVVISALEAVDLGLAASRQQIRHSLAGNLCRCTGYVKIIDAVEAYRDGVSR
jgi:aerobic carbon-monoxide dehydrogenase small subunit